MREHPPLLGLQGDERIGDLAHPLLPRELQPAGRSVHCIRRRLMQLIAAGRQEPIAAERQEPQAYRMLVAPGPSDYLTPTFLKEASGSLREARRAADCSRGMLGAELDGSAWAAIYVALRRWCHFLGVTWSQA